MEAIAYSYVRFSHGRQAKGVSVERQVELARAFTARMGWQLDESLTHDRGRSAYHGENLSPAAGLGQFLERVKTGRVAPGSVLIIENLDRLSRAEIEVAVELFLGIINRGVRIQTLTPEMLYASPLGYAMFQAVGEFFRGNSESAVKNSRGVDRWQRKRDAARKGESIITGAVPRWLAPDRKAQSWAVDPAKKKVITNIFTWCIEGVGVSQITRKLNEAGVTPFDTRKRRSGRAVWTTRYVNSILRGRAVLGEYQPGTYKGRKRTTEGQQPIPGYYPAVVDEATYYLAQSALNSRLRKGGPRTKNKNLFIGMLWDAWNKVKFYTAAKGHGLQLVSEIWWEEKRERGSVPSFPYDRFEGAVLRHLREVRPSDLVEGHKGDRLAELSGRLVEVEGALEEIRPRLIGKGIGMLLDRVAELDAEREKILAAVRAEKTRMANGLGDTLGEAHGLIDVLDKPGMRAKLRGRLSLLVDSVWVAVLQSNHRVKKYRPKAAVVELVFKSGVSRFLYIPWGGDESFAVTVRFADPVLGLRQDPDWVRRLWNVLGLPPDEAHESAMQHPLSPDYDPDNKCNFWPLSAPWE